MGLTPRTSGAWLFSFLSHAPWSALAAVGRGASGEKTMGVVRTNDQLYKAKVKHYGLRSGLGDVVKG